jgi:hypothetical protein
LDARQALAEGLAALAARMAPKDAAELLTQAMTKTPVSQARRALAEGLAAVAYRMDPKDAAPALRQAADILIRALNETTDALAYQALAQGLAAMAAYMEPQDAARVAAWSYFAWDLPTSYAQLLGRLETAGLVELLKQPLTVGKTRRLVLDELGNRYQRRFADQWVFVRFAKEQNLGFELAGPPQVRQTTELKFP